MALQRRKAPGGKDEPLVSELLALCDRLRDSSLPALGVRAHDGKAASTAAAGAARRWHFDASLVAHNDPTNAPSKGS